MIPTFSPVKNTGYTIPTAVTKTSSKTATVQARNFARMVRAYLASQPDIAKVPPFVGYCAFVAGMVLSAVLSFVGKKRGQEIRRDGAIYTLLLWELKVYWPVLEFFVGFHYSLPAASIGGIHNM